MRRAALAALLLAGCPAPVAPPQAAAASAADPSTWPPPASATARRYRVRAEIASLPRPGAPLREVGFRHEAIPDFVGQDGKVAGMAPMLMLLEVAPGASLDGLVPGDPVELALDVDWTRGGYRVAHLRRLPAGTPLDLTPSPSGAPRPPDAPRP